MTKREISVILAGASQKEIIEIAAAIQESCEIQIMKPPQKTLVMVKARESVKKSLFCQRKDRGCCRYDKGKDRKCSRYDKRKDGECSGYRKRKNRAGC